MSTGDEDWSECSKGTNDWKSKELVTTGQSVLGKAAKIRHIDSKGREKANNDVQGGESAICGIHVG